MTKLNESRHICLAAYEGPLNAVMSIITSEPEAFKYKDEDLRTPLHWSVMGGKQDITEYLIGLGADVCVKDDADWTPLHIAVSSGYFEIAKFLIQKGADVNCQNENGQTPLFYAASKNRIDCLELLLNSGADPSILDKFKQSPLHRASVKGYIGIMKILIKHNLVQIDLADSMGNTSLHLACEDDHGEAVHFLVESGANIRCMNNEKKLPIDLCSKGVRSYLERMFSVDQ